MPDPVSGIRNVDIKFWQTEMAERLESTEQQLVSTEQQLVSTEEQLKRTEEELKSTEEELKSKEERLQNKMEQLKSKEEQYAALFEELGSSHDKCEQLESQYDTGAIALMRLSQTIASMAVA